MTVTIIDTVGEFGKRSKIESGGADVSENTTTLADAQRHPAVTPRRAVDVDLAALADRLQCSPRPALQSLHGDWKQGTIERPQPEKVQGRVE